LFPVLKQLEYEYPDKKDQLVKEILDLFDKEIEAETLSNIKKRLSDEVKKINRCVNDYLFDNDSINDINHIVSRTELIFGIPKVVKSVFKDIPKAKSRYFFLSAISQSSK
jgi:vacuolar-type H+-ATPase subunit D/Vma8